MAIISIRPGLVSLLRSCLLILCLLPVLNPGFGQSAPSISYTTPQVLARNVAVTISPTNSGGAVPSGTYRNVSILAGTTQGFQDATGATARFNRPAGMTIDGSGNLYIADTYSHRIRKVTPAGVVTTIAGDGFESFGWARLLNGNGTSASFNYPTDIVIHPDGTCLYVADKENDVIRRIELTTPFAVTTFAGDGTGAGSVAGGFADNATATSAKFYQPEGLFFDNSGATHYLYVADRANHRIRRIQLVGTTGAATAGAVTTIAGSTSGSTEGAAVASAKFNQPVQVAVSADGNIVYVADWGNHKIRKIDVTGATVSTLAGSGTAGGAEGTGSSATFNNPYGIEFDGAANLIVSDQTGHRIRRVTIAGVVTNLAGTGSAAATDGVGSSAAFNTPSGMVFNAGNSLLYICDLNNSRIRKIEMSGYEASPSLPTGLSLAAGTGVISGTPAALSAAANYIVSAYNQYGSSAATITIEVVDLPTLTTNAITVNSTTANSGGIFSSAGSTSVSAKGLVWSTAPSPTVDLLTKTGEGAGTTAFTSSMTGLTPKTTYYVRAYATTAAGTSYGNELCFTTLLTDASSGPDFERFVNVRTANGLGHNTVYDVFVVDNKVYAATEGGLSISTDWGVTFTNRTTANGLGANNVRSVFVAGNTVYAATGGGLSISTNGGVNFTNRTTTNGLGNNLVLGVYVVGSVVYAATDGGLSISTDGGTNFTNRLSGYSVSGVHVEACSIYATSDDGLHKSTDGGSTFNVTLAGIEFRRVYAVGNTLYAGSRYDGLYKSTNGGASFTQITTFDINNLAFDDVLDVFAVGSTLYAATGNGLSISTDGGNNFWNYYQWVGLGSNYITGVYIYNNKIYVSTNAGLSFSETKATWNGSVSNDWSTPANWTPASVPSSIGTVDIPATVLTNYPTIPSTLTLANLTNFNGGFALGASEITLIGALSNDGSISGSGKIIMSGSSAQTIAGTGTLTNLEINNSAGVTITFGASHRQTITGVLTPTLGALITNGNLTLRSDATGTARVAALGVAASISGNVVAERYIKQNANISGTGRAWRLVSIPVTGTGTLRNFFMNGSFGLDFTNSAAVLGETVGAGTPIVGHNHATASAAGSAQFDWIGVPNQVSSLRRYVGNASGGTFLSSDVPEMSTTYTSAEQGYMVFVRGDRRLTFPSSSSSSATTLRSTGSLKTGNQPVNVVPAATSKYTLVGNPYMSVLDLSALQTEYASVIKPSFWIWDANISGTQRQGGYVNVFHNGTSWVTNTGAYTNPQRIESGMAFFVEPVDGLSATTPIVIKEAHKSSSTSSGMAPFGSETSDGHGILYARLEMSVAGDRRELVDGVLIDFHKDFKLSLGDLSDREKMRNTISTGGIWLSREQKLLAAEGLPWPGVDERSIPLYMSAVGSQKLVVRLAPSGLEDQYVKVWLKDNHLNTTSEMDITKGLDYTFTGTGNPSSDSSRFEIVYVEAGRPSTGVTLEPDDAAEQPSVKLYPNPSKSSDVKLSMRAMAPGSYSVHVLDMTGRLVATSSLQHRSVNGEYRILEGRLLSSGTYIMRLSDPNQQLKETLRLVVE